MIVFKRKPNERSIITVPPSDKPTTIEVVNVGRHTSQVGIDAPRCCPVHRQEVYERIQREERCKTE